MEVSLLVMDESLPSVEGFAELKDSETLLREMDILYEQELQRSPYDQKIWYRYVMSKSNAPPSVRFLLYERAIKFLPGSYKLWWNYLQDRMKVMDQECITDASFESVNNAFERCIVHHSRMPRIWLDYCYFLEKQRWITRTRRTYDRALRSLPITQHSLLWEKYLSFIKSAGLLQTSLCVYRRYLMLEPENVEAYIDLLNSEEAQKWDEAALLLSKIVNDETFLSKKGKTNHQLWMELCELITHHPADIHSLRVEPVLRAGLRKFTDEVGRLWCSLADHFIRLGLLEKARDVYEEGMANVLSLHDFAMIFDAYSAFEESVLTALMGETSTEELEVDLSLSRLEHLMDRRPELVSSVKLRQNPHNVYEWLSRTELYTEDPIKVIQTFSEGVLTVDPEKSVGKLSLLWSKFAKYYESHDDLENAETIYLKATFVPFKTVDELASIWCEWIEMELLHQRYKKALEVARQSISRPFSPSISKTSQNRIHRSVKLWSCVMDLEKRFYEDSFKIYERGVALFQWPHLNDLWLMYLTKFVSRYGASKLERARELFEQAVMDVPPLFAKKLFILYARLEEEFGLAKRALQIYHQATKSVKEDEKLEMYNIYISKTSELFGIAKTRPIYEEAIQILPTEQIRSISLRYANVEKGLGEIDRGRAIYEHASQFCDPNKDEEFWKIWREFEVLHGNEDTFREMLRLKRSVLAQYSQIHFNAAELVAEGSPSLPLDPMAAAEKELKEKKHAETLKLERKEVDIASSMDQRKFEEQRDILAAQEEYQRKHSNVHVASTGPPLFVSAIHFEGLKSGYVFKRDSLGVGYYRETSVENSTEEVNIDMEDLILEIQETPAEVYGTLSEVMKKKE
ncbi:XPA binding protein 2 family protein [Cardiosporidium cionae]|uniref:XPA binding protein 2 family protein n=1 Tax=Cardiosporidium cionae TaxID=476202 RepID=A0ABQ7J9Z6_9APIC|nr:XPA binding protein 2 family protein [Cardiosporidium cionae]|eukprot:KAF8820822.1 XPA binding protein 2 family protein [Cardiosporidium cionae]